MNILPNIINVVWRASSKLVCMCSQRGINDVVVRTLCCQVSLTMFNMWPVLSVVSTTWSSNRYSYLENDTKRTGHRALRQQRTVGHIPQVKPRKPRQRVGLCHNSNHLNQPMPKKQKQTNNNHPNWGLLKVVTSLPTASAQADRHDATSQWSVSPAARFLISGDRSWWFLRNENAEVFPRNMGSELI